MKKTWILALMLAGQWVSAEQNLPPVVEAGTGSAGGTVNERLSRLERSNRVMLDMLSRIDRLQQEVSQLRGANEQLTYEIESLKKQQRNVYLDMDNRLQALEAGGSAGANTAAGGGYAAAPLLQVPAEPAASPQMPAASTQQPVTGQSAMPPAAGMSDTPAGTAPAAPKVLTGATTAQRNSYTAAYNTLMAGSYSAAISQFQQFLASNPSTDLSDNAQYWLAEAFYVTRDFQQARQAFQKVIDEYQGSSKIPDAKLKLGFIDYETADYSNARKRLAAVVSDYPGTSAARLASNRLQQMSQESR